MAIKLKNISRWRVNRHMYGFTRKVRGAVESGRGKKSTSKASTETIDHHHHQQQHLQDVQVQTLQQRPSEALQIVVENNGGENVPEDEPRPPESGWVISIKEKLKQAGQANSECSWAKHSIYRIPQRLKNGEDKAYIPQIVSLGPYHHDKAHLRQMDSHKWRCLHCILQRTNHKILHYLDTVKEVEETARACYEGKISMSSDEFVEMMVLDGCFVIELLQGFDKGFKELGYPEDDPIFSMRGPTHMIQRDMIMLENQIPLFILDQLHCLQDDHPYQEGFSALALWFFDTMKPTDEHLTKLSRNSLELNPLYSQGAPHCLELFRQSLLHPGPNQVETGDLSHKRQQVLHCETEFNPLCNHGALQCLELFRRCFLHLDVNKAKAKGVTELRKAGIEFRKRETERFWDIHFENGTLHIPQLVIHDGTRSLFLNLIAFEQCHFHCGSDITSYVIFMDNLINSPKDIRHLHECGIIEHWLGSDTEVANLFNQLCQEVAFDSNDSYLSALSEKVNNYTSHSWNRWRFILKNKYFSNPWSIISFIAASVLLVLTFIQTFYGVYSYYRLSS